MIANATIASWKTYFIKFNWKIGASIVFKCYWIAESRWLFFCCISINSCLIVLRKTYDEDRITEHVLICHKEPPLLVSPAAGRRPCFCTELILIICLLVVSSWFMTNYNKCWIIPPCFNEWLLIYLQFNILLSTRPWIISATCAICWKFVHLSYSNCELIKNLSYVMYYFNSSVNKSFNFKSKVIY